MKASFSGLVVGLGVLAVSVTGCGNSVTTGAGGATSSGSTTATSTASTTGVTTSVTASTSSSGVTTSASSTSTGLAMCTPSDGAILAIDTLFVGDKNPDGTASATAWKQYGLNIDGQNTVSDFSMHCTANSGASPANVFPNGNGGIDNSFGHNIVPLLNSVSMGFSDSLNASIAQGNAGYIFDLVGLMAAGDQTGFTTRFYSGDPLGGPAKFDGTDCWPVDASTLNVATDITSAKSAFQMGTLTSNVWSTGAPQTLVLTITVQGYAMSLTLHHAVVTAALDATHKGATAGEISGVIDTEELVSTVKQLAGTFSPALCTGGTLDAIETQIRQASDMLNDGTQDPTKMCNGISIGLGFTAKAISLGGIGPASPPPAMPCP